MSKKYLILPLLILTFACGGGNNYDVVNTEEEATFINEKVASERPKEDRVFFKFDSSALSDRSKRTLDKIANWLENNKDVNILIEGHCDERGTREYNLALGQRRANAVKKYLVSQGISAKRIKTISYGKEKPAVLGKGEAVWSKNRRSVIVKR